MTHRERTLAVLDRRSPDRVPWVPRLQLWYNARRREGSLPDRFQGMSLREIERTLGLGTPARDGRVFRERHDDMQVEVTHDGGEEVTAFITPVGTVVRRRVVEEGLEGYVDSGLETRYPIREAADYDVWEYVAEHTHYEPTYDEYRAYDESIGDDGLPLVSTGDCPFHHFAMRLCGYGQAYFELNDRRERVEQLLRVMTDVERERLWPVVAESPARLILHGVHFDSQMTPPRLFDRYIAPYYRPFSALLHQHGKSLSFHADDDTRLILGHTREAGFDMGECFTTAPMVSCTLAEARAAWGHQVIIWGGIPSVILEPTTSDAEFEDYVLDVLRTIAPGDAFIFGVADNVMPLSSIERVERITQLVEQFGTYPIRVPEAIHAH
jgi:uroporphyrinogen-III decarboxylase